MSFPNVRTAEFDAAMRRPPPEKRKLLEVFVIPCSSADAPPDVVEALKGWEIRIHRLDCGHTMGPYLIRSSGNHPPSNVVCWTCQKQGARLRQGNSKSPKGTSKP